MDLDCRNRRRAGRFFIDFELSSLWHRAYDLQQASRAAIVVTDAQLAELGQARAVAIQHALLTDTGLEPMRVFLTREGRVTTQDGKIRFELGLK